MSITVAGARAGLTRGLIELRLAFSGAELIGQLFWPVATLVAVFLLRDVPVGYFFDGLTSTPGAVKASPQQRLMIELARNFMAISDRRQQEAICNLGRSLANRDLGDDLDTATEDQATAA